MHISKYDESGAFHMNNDTTAKKDITLNLLIKRRSWWRSLRWWGDS